MQIKNWESHHDSLIKNKVPFTVEITSLTIRIKSQFGNFEFTDKKRGSPLPRSELWLMKKVLDYAAKQEFNFSVDRKTIKYIEHPKIENFHAENIIEIDLTSAYWNFALQEKIISPDIFKAAEKVSKPVRLAALGNLAKHSYKWSFDGLKWKLDSEHENPKANYFFRCCELTSLLMQQLKMEAGKSFLFFWVDAIFILPEGKEAIESYLKANNVPFKTTVCDLATMQLSPKYLTVFSQDRFFNGKDEPRKFYLKRKTFDLLN